MRKLRTSLCAGLLAVLLLPCVAQAQIAFRASSSAINANMAVQQRAVGAVASGTGATVTPALPTRVAGDRLLLVIEVRDTNALTIANWTLLTQGTTGTTHRAAVYHRTATNTAADTATINHAAAPIARNVLIARIVAFANVDAASPFDGTAVIGSSATNTVATGGITTTNACSLRVATVHIADDNTITTAPAGWLLSFFSTTATGNDAGIGLWYRNAVAAGAQASVSIVHSAADPAHAAQFALQPGGLTVAVPAGTAAGDVMVATIATRPDNTTATNANAATVCPPAGWTLVRSTINIAGGTSGTGARLQTYVRVATGAEPASYTWYAQLNIPSVSPATRFVSGVGAIASYSGVDNTTPVNVEGGNLTAVSFSHTGNSITTTVANTMLVSSHTFLSADTWTPPAGMTERIDQSAPASPPGNAAGIALEVSEEARPAAGATGTRTAVAGGTSATDRGIVHMLALRPAPPSTPGRFNAFETSTAAGSITGVIQTRVAGVAISVDIVAINPAFTGVLTTFTGSVLVEILDSSNNSGALNATTNCRASWTTVIATVTPNPAFVAGDNGRKTVSVTVPNVYRDVRVRVSYPVASPTVTGCSTDNFAIRPASFAVAVSDNTWDTAGTNRALTNIGASGGVVHKAGQNFTIRVTPAPASATNYNGDVTVSAIACTLPSPCTTGGLTVGTFTNPVVGSGMRESITAKYTEAGAFNLTLVDQTFANVDALDGTPANCTGLHICQSAAPIAVGRFVPDHFALTSVTAPVFRTFDATDAACSVPPSGARRSFTYIGQLFGYVTAPVATVVAQDASNSTTTNYRGTLWKLAATDLAQAFANTPAKPITPALQTPALSAIGNGTATLTGNSADKISFDRDNTTASAPFNADLRLSWTVSDAAENVANQGIIGTPTALDFSSIAFDDGNAFRYGRLRLGNANGSQLVALPVIMEAQYWGTAALGFVTNTADHCTSIGNANVEMSTFSGNLAACETAVSGGGTLTAGRRTLVLPAPGSANDGAVILTANLGPAASGTTCVVVGGGTVAAGGADRLYLQGNWVPPGPANDDNPTARATFGVFKGAGEVIFIRENF